MKQTLFITLIILNLAGFAQNKDSLIVKNIYSFELANGKCYDNLKQLCKNIGGRLSGSPQAAKAVDWAKKTMESNKAETVTLQECMVPHWVRGDKETVKLILAEKEITFNSCALGGSVPTGANGLKAKVIEVRSFEELEKLGSVAVKGKIVFFNAAMNPANINPFESYRETGKYRWRGAQEAAKYGALASITRSLTVNHDDFPHTGSMGYKDSIPKIPAAAISTNAADQLSELLKLNSDADLFIQLNCKTLADEKSYNVIGEIKGSEFPEEIIVVGGHLDSWDTGEGAHDDGAGVVQSMEVIRLFKELNIKPKRTIRVVAFMNEENGTRGGKKYAEAAKANNEKHIVAIESDAGGFTPRGFGFETNEAQGQKLKSWEPLFEPYGVHNFRTGGGGSDIEPLYDNGVPMIELLPDAQRYFDVHHTANDIFENVNKRELELGAASLAALVYLLSEYGF